MMQIYVYSCSCVRVLANIRGKIYVKMVPKMVPKWCKMVTKRVPSRGLKVYLCFVFDFNMIFGSRVSFGDLLGPPSKPVAVPKRPRKFNTGTFWRPGTAQELKKSTLGRVQKFVRKIQEIEERTYPPQDAPMWFILGTVEKNKVRQTSQK